MQVMDSRLQAEVLVDLKFQFETLNCQLLTYPDPRARTETLSRCGVDNRSRRFR